MGFVDFEGRRYERRDGESVLDALLRCGVEVSHSCKAGSCGACMMRATGGAVPEKAQAGLKDTWKARGYFLSCACTPDGDLAVATAEADTQTPARVVDLELVSGDVMRVRLRCEGEFDFRAGQYLTLRTAAGVARSYSIASLPEDGVVELHVRLLAGGRMSEWLRSEARAGDGVAVQGPAGDCFYLPGDVEQPLLLAGTGTGLAPLYGIVRDALRSGHRGPVRLFHGALRVEGLYLREELRRLAALHENFEYVAAVLAGEGPDVEVGEMDGVILRRIPDLKGWRGYVCGDPPLVQKLKKKLFLSGMAMRDIHADAFLPPAA
ncbi:MAG: 2Fe-2S iron-sulfur cluster binding domain-containing protein [Bryobacterales bacterium]|nr:2Fe-2S iron-sulfur cluster binding domain-containing protein [Bryobacterales bacterium]